MKIEYSQIVDQNVNLDSLDNAIRNWIKSCPEYEDNGNDTSSFIIVTVTVDFYNRKQLEKMKAKHFEIYDSFKDAIKRFKRKIKN